MIKEKSSFKPMYFFYSKISSRNIKETSFLLGKIETFGYVKSGTCESNGMKLLLLLSRIKGIQGH